MADWTLVGNVHLLVKFREGRSHLIKLPPDFRDPGIHLLDPPADLCAQRGRAQSTQGRQLIQGQPTTRGRSVRDHTFFPTDTGWNPETNIQQRHGWSEIQDSQKRDAETHCEHEYMSGGVSEINSVSPKKRSTYVGSNSQGEKKIIFD